MRESAIVARERGLHKSLTRAQAVMIGLGGTIGTGLFMGSGIAIGYAGPAVIVSYAIAGLAALIVVFSLSEMAVAHPAAGSFGVYAEAYLNPWAGFMVRYTYWLAQVVAIGGEAVAAGLYMTYWFPGIPVWIWSVGFAIGLLYVNSRSVANFGSFEYWFALIKVVAIIFFIILGLAAIFGVGSAPVGLHNVIGLPGGFFPHGFGGVWMAVIVGIFSFFGIEVIAVASGELREPVKAIPAALRTLTVRLLLFYVLGLSVVVAFVPWTATGATVVAQSPFVKVLTHSGVAYAAGIMNFVIVTAALSSINTNIYLCSRMIFSLSRGGYAPRLLGKLNKSGVPVGAILASGAGIMVSAALSRLTPLAYNYLFGIALFDAIVVWMIILASHLIFRLRHGHQTLAVRAPLFPYLQIAGLLLLAAVLVTMGLSPAWDLSWIVGVPWLILITAIYFIWKRWGRRETVLATGD
ncbi:MAG TPA: amino acid permease [Rhizomicrobium sp.]|nr:amino acid permease [Rhizomicrobium sp.]